MDAFSVNISDANSNKPPVRQFATGRMLHAVLATSVEATKQLDSNALSSESPSDIGKRFVEYMIKNNQKEFDAMLNNQFCKDMAAASSDAEVAKVLKGYRWYTVQDLKYCQGLIRYYVKRATKASTTAELLTEANNIKSSYDYAQAMLTYCVENLGISADAIAKAQTVDAVTNYTKLEADTADQETWATSMIVTIPCIQGYCKIAKNMMKSVVRDDTPWYEGWIIPNLTPGYAKDQFTFFGENMADWEKQSKDPIVQAKWDKIFKAACQCEVGVFDIGENPQPI